MLYATNSPYHYHLAYLETSVVMNLWHLPHIADPYSKLWPPDDARNPRWLLQALRIQKREAAEVSSALEDTQS